MLNRSLKRLVKQTLPPSMVGFEAMFSNLIIQRIQFTEIDWQTYMQQVSKFLNGERNYLNISGDTGPAVYPALFLYVYSILYRISDAGTDLLMAQRVFVGLYVITLAMIVAVYLKVKAPISILPILVLSKRLHSIFLLRLFNDCWSAFFTASACLAWTYSREWLCAFFFALALGMKMNALLFLPGLCIIFLLNFGILKCMLLMLFTLGLQIIIGIPFLIHYPYEYLGQAYDFTRTFLFEWTVNWRFVGLDTFNSPVFHQLLLCGHLMTLSLFAFYRWGIHHWLFDLLKPNKNNSTRSYRKLSPIEGLEILLTSNQIGILFARSLHYQFFSWFAWWSPLLLSQSRVPIWAIYMICFTQEYAWNVFYSTELSSILCVVCIALPLILLLIAPKKSSLAPTRL